MYTNITGAITVIMMSLAYSVVESFENVIAIFAQRLPLNSSATFTLSSVTLVAESVSS